MCQQSKHHTPEQTYDTLPAPPHADPVPNTPLSISQLHTQTHLTAIISHLLPPSLWSAVSLSLLRSVHLLGSLFPHVYPRLHVNSHMALLAQVCHITRHAARCLGVTDAVLQGVSLTFPHVRPLFILANHSAITREPNLSRAPDVRVADCRSATTLKPLTDEVNDMDRGLMLMWMFFDPQIPPKHCFRQIKPPPAVFSAVSHEAQSDLGHFEAGRT